ncbi:MAG: DUF1566 domain-containing protein, partial [Deltaproteobacteria bacterium]|nr:DUF1566 domain-containing protein [Deltaproteobacteria bacterium]
TDTDTDTKTDTSPPAPVWLDTRSGLTWQQFNWHTHRYFTWEEARQYCNQLDYNGNTDWRVPSVGELRSLVRGCAAISTGGPCKMDDDCMDLSCLNADCYQGCSDAPNKGPGYDGCYWPAELRDVLNMCGGPYWSSSDPKDRPDNMVEVVSFAYGRIYRTTSSETDRVRCVRGP